MLGGIMKQTEQIDLVLHELIKLDKKGIRQPEKFKEGMLTVGVDGGRFIETIVSLRHPLRGLEIGTSSGYSALWAMRGAIGTGFRLTTVDYDPAKAEWAGENFRRAGVADNIVQIVDKGLSAVKAVDGPFDYVLLDATKRDNLPMMEALLPKLNLGAIVLTDNAITHKSELTDFFQFVRNHPDLVSGLIELGNGIEMTVKLGKGKD